MIGFRKFTVSGYLYNGAFYEDSSHTTKLIFDQDLLYRDKTGKGVYFYNGTTFELWCQDASKQGLLTSITGYDATKTQVLKHVSGVMQWVDAE